MIARIAAIGDLHVRARTRLGLSLDLSGLERDVDLLLVAGDLTDAGLLVEADAVARCLRACRVPVVAVLGNHDLRCLRRRAFRRRLLDAGVILLDGTSTVVHGRSGVRIGVAGVAGCGGGFWPGEGPVRFPSRAMKALALRSRRETARLDHALALVQVQADVRVALTHFAPTTSTLGREPLSKYWMLGNAELGRTIDRYRVDLAVHGHAHLGCAVGRTAGGTPVRNVALPVTQNVSLIDVVARARPGVEFVPGGAFARAS